MFSLLHFRDNTCSSANPEPNDQPITKTPEKNAEPSETAESKSNNETSDLKISTPKDKSKGSMPKRKRKFLQKYVRAKVLRTLLLDVCSYTERRYVASKSL